jgi:AraC-like DNA-binding protein
MTFKVIAILLFFLFIRFLFVHLYLNGNIFDYPHFLLLNDLTSRIGIPILFLMVWYHIQGRTKLSKIHLLHFLPFIFFIINFWDILFASADQKRIYLFEMEKFGYNFIWEKGKFFTNFWLKMFRLVPFYVYTLWIGYLIIKKKDFKKLPLQLQNLFKMFFYFLLANLIPVILASFGSKLMDSFFVANFAGLVSTLFISIVFFFMPNFLYGEDIQQSLIPLDNADDQQYINKQVEEQLDFKNDIISKEEKLMNRLEVFLEEHHSFLNSEFSLKSIEKDLNISGRYISTAIKSKKGLNFNQYIHQKRMDYFLNQYVNNLNVATKTIEEVAADLGYKSINTFYINFKNSTGMTPKEFFEQSR